MTTEDYKVGHTTKKLINLKPFGFGNYYFGIDPATPQGDYGCVTTWKKVGKFRKLLRRLKLDRSTWEYKIVNQEFIK